MNEIETVIKELLAAMDFPDLSVVRRDTVGQAIFSIQGAADARTLVGMHGDTIHAIDHLVKKIAEKRLPADLPAGASAKEGASGERGPDHERAPASPQTSQGGPMFLVDVDDYRTRQIKDLETKAKMMAERARSLQYDVELTPMSAYERLIVHTALADEPNVKTESQGEGRSRRVVIKYSTEA